MILVMLTGVMKIIWSLIPTEFELKFLFTEEGVEGGSQLRH